MSCDIVIEVPYSLFNLYNQNSNCGEKLFRELLDDQQKQLLITFTKIFGWKVFRYLALNNITTPTLYCKNCGALLSQSAILQNKRYCKKCITINPSNRVPQPQNFVWVDREIVIPDQLVELIKTHTSASLVAAIAKTQHVNWFINNHVTLKTACWVVNNGSNIIKPIYCKACGKQLTEDQYTAGSQYCCIKCAATKYEIPQPPLSTILQTPVEIPEQFWELYCQAYCENLSKAHSRTLYKLLIDNGYQKWFIENNVTVRATFIEVANRQKTIQPKYCIKCGSLLPLSAFENRSLECAKCKTVNAYALDSEYAQYGLNGLPRSNKEYQLIQFVHDLIPNETIEYNKRYPLDNKYELDIYIPNRKLAFEFNGQFYHCDAFQRITPSYHQDKTNACLEKGIRLIHVFEWEWDHNKERVQQLIKDALNIDCAVVGARQTKVQPIDSQTYNQFVNKYHFDHSVSASIRLGLFYNDQLIAVGGWRKSRFDSDQYELVRYAVKDQYKIVGGLAKLCKACGLNQFISYVDRAHFTGKAYQSTPGFVEIQRTQPSYCYVRGNDICTRYQAQKHLLSHKLKNFDPNVSEQQNMLNNGWFRVYDCGTIKYQWTRNEK